MQNEFIWERIWCEYYRVIYKDIRVLVIKNSNGRYNIGTINNKVLTNTPFDRDSNLTKTEVNKLIKAYYENPSGFVLVDRPEGWGGFVKASFSGNRHQEYIMNNYGGAYDIGEYDYFTKEEIVEFAETVAEDVSAEVGAYYEVSDVYMDYSGGRQNLTVILIGDDGEYVIKHTIDMRKIKTPTDLFKAYLNVYINDFVKDIDYWN